VHTFEASLSNTPGVILYLGNKQPKSARLALFLMDLPLDCFGLIVEKLGSNDVTSLLYVNKQVREDTLATLSPQQCLWAAGKILNKEYAERALFAGARINKIDQGTGKSVLKLIEGRSGGEQLYARLERWNDHTKTFGPSVYSARAQTQEELDRHLVRCVKQFAGLDFYGECYEHINDLHPYEESDYLDYGVGCKNMGLSIKEALLDGADPNVRTRIVSMIDMEGGLLHLLTVDPTETLSPMYSDCEDIVDIIRELKSFGIDMNQVDSKNDKDLPSQETALHYACWAKTDLGPCEPGIRPAIVKALLDCGADPNKANSRGMTCLHDLVFLLIPNDLTPNDLTPDDLNDNQRLLEENNTLVKMLFSYGHRAV